MTPPGDLDLTDPTAVEREGAAWLAHIWARCEVREAVGLSSPDLAAGVERLLADGCPAGRRLRRTVASLASYMLRWERRATPFGMFAGVTTAALGPAAAKVGTGHRVVVRADAEWLTELINHIEQNRALRMRLSVVTDNTGTVRDGHFIVLRRADLGARSPGPLREASVRLTAPIAYALDQAVRPQRLAVLADRMSQRFPSAGVDQIHRLLHGLIDGGFLITSLRPASTIEDPLNHLIQELRRAGVHETADEELAEIADLLDQLEAVNARLVEHNTTADPVRSATLRAEVTDTMRSLATGTGHVLAADLRLNAYITMPEPVLKEAERAADVLLRLSAQPFGTTAWLDYHARFRARYGTGALVPIRELLADSGLGYPHGHLGAPRARPAWRALTQRDATLMAMIQQALVDGLEEIRLSDADVQALMIGDQNEAVVPPRIELGVALHADSAEAINRGDFTLHVVAAPRAHTSMIGRFAYLLDEADRARLARTYAPADGDAVVAQLSFAPRRPHNDNVVRVAPHAGTVVLPLAEHPDTAHDHSCASGAGRGVLSLDDLAVTADADQMYLVQRSTGRRVLAYIPHALDTTVQTPPLARFLAEVADARSAVFGPLDLGAARTLPYVPRIRYRRTVLSPARWLLNQGDLTATSDDWEEALRRWRDRWKVPARVVLCHGELRLPLNLDQPLDRWLLRTRLNKTEQVELREDASTAGQGWAERATELVIPMVAATAPTRRLPATTPPGVVHQPGDALLLRAHLVGNPARFDTILARHLPAFVHQVGAPIRRWWASRHRDLIRLEADQYLVVLFRLADQSQYGPVAARLAAFAQHLQARGLLAQLVLAPTAEQSGRYGHGPALEAAEEVFTADTAAAIAQITMVQAAGVAAQAVAAASMTHLAASFAPDTATGYRTLVRCAKQRLGPVAPDVRDITFRLADPADDFAAVRALPCGDAVATAWQNRARALATYHHLLAQQRNPEDLLTTLLHGHHVRALGLDPEHEATTIRLARAAALRNLATTSPSAGAQ
ncbi:UNVERIFIED_ORG: thiopeptide-type bacteriocin biosynthesis protein [Actinomadura viridilutea]